MYVFDYHSKINFTQIKLYINITQCLKARLFVGNYLTINIFNHLIIP